MSYLDVIALKTCSIVPVNYTQHAHVHQLSQMDSIGMNLQTGGGAQTSLSPINCDGLFYTFVITLLQNANKNHLDFGIM